jgi:hypothetical protein
MIDVRGSVRSEGMTPLGLKVRLFSILRPIRRDFLSGMVSIARSDRSAVSLHAVDVRATALFAAILVSCGSPGSSGLSVPLRDPDSPRERALASGERERAPAARERGLATEHGEPGPTGSDLDPATPPESQAPRISLRGLSGPEGHVAIVLENRGTETVRVAGALIVERRAGDGSWVPLDGTSDLGLRDDCERPVPDCRELAPGAALRPPPWLGTGRDAQCTCASCGPIEPATYRFVATTCGGGHRIEGEPFDIEAP